MHTAAVRFQASRGERDGAAAAGPARPRPGAEPEGSPAACLISAAKFLCISLSGSKTNSWLWGNVQYAEAGLGRAGGQGHGWGPALTGCSLDGPTFARAPRWAFLQENERSGQCCSGFAPFLKQIPYMYINRRQIDTTYFLYFLLHLCVPGLNSPLVMLRSAGTRSVRREARCALTWQVDSGGSEALE